MRKTCRRIRHADSLLEGAQKKVETYYYDIRKQVFEYDEVMNNQRRAVYQSAGVLDGRALKKQASATASAPWARSLRPM